MNEVLFKKSKNLSEVIEEFIYARKAERYSPATVQTYVTVLRMFERCVGGTVRFDSIGADSIRKFLAEKSDLSDKTMNNYHVVLASLWTWATENKLSSEHVVNKIKRPKYVKKQVSPFDEKEIRQIYKACRNWRERAIVMTLLDCGIRASELVNLDVDDWKPGMLHIRNGKGRKSRHVPITEATEKAIFRQLGKRVITLEGVNCGTALFSSDLMKIPLSYDSLRYMMKRLERRSSVSTVHAHRFRHTFAINYLRNGGDIYTLKRIMGHETLSMVQHYLDIARTDITKTHHKASPITNWHIGE